jgi:hypothetical protein
MDVGIQMGLDRAHDPLIDKEDKSLCIKTRISKQGDGSLVIQKEHPAASGAGELPETPSSRKCPWCNNKAIQTPHHTDAAACASHRLIMGGDSNLRAKKMPLDVRS